MVLERDNGEVPIRDTRMEEQKVGLKCPNCGKVGNEDDFNYRHTVMVPNEEPYQTVWYEWYLWLCFWCGTHFVSTEEIR